MYYTFLRLGYTKEFTEASKNNWGLDGLILAKAVVEATAKADEKVENRISYEWFEAYRDAFQEIIYRESPILKENNPPEKTFSREDSENQTSQEKEQQAIESEKQQKQVNTKNLQVKSFKKIFLENTLLSQEYFQNKGLKQVLFLKLLNEFLT